MLSPNCVYIPYVKTDPYSLLLILGILRGLRNNTEFTLPVPDYYLNALLTD
jgi:hypothetical protein